MSVIRSRHVICVGSRRGLIEGSDATGVLGRVRIVSLGFSTASFLTDSSLTRAS
jgi:hypothetical protein